MRSRHVSTSSNFNHSPQSLVGRLVALTQRTAQATQCVHWKLLIAAALSTAPGAVAVGAPPAESEPATEPAGPTEAEIRRWIAELDAPQFAKRQAASQQLFEAGRPAIAALQRAAAEGSREVMMRAIDVLKRHTRSAGATQEAARDALLELSEAPESLVARTAHEALKPPAAALPRNEVARRPAQQGAVPGVPNQILPGGIQLGNGAIQLQIQGGVPRMGNAGGVRRMQMQNVNGNKKILAEQPGRKVSIEEQATGPIKIEVTETKDGKEVTRKAEVKDVNELKKNHAELHKIYEEFSQGARPVQLPAGILPNAR
jgi:hypothetical protein